MKPTYDVVVAGLGAVGSAVAYQLASRGVRVLGVDRHGPPHDRGSSHGETRITRLALGEGEEYVPLVRRAHAIWRRLERATGRRLLRQVGGLVYGPGGRRGEAHGALDFLSTTVSVARRHGIRHETLDARDLAARFPQFRFRGDEEGYYEPDAGLVYPEECVAAQVSEAVRSGAVLGLGESLVGWRETGEGGVEVTTTRGVVSAGALVCCAGSWIPGLVPALAVRARVCRQVLGWFLPDGPSDLFAPERTPVYIRVPDAGDAMFYGFPEVGGRGSGVKIATEQFERTVDPDASGPEVGEGELEALHAAIAPHVRLRRGAVRGVACKYTVLPGFRFVVDHPPGSGRVWVVSACSGHGFKHSAGVGELLADWVSAGGRPPELAAFGWEPASGAASRGEGG